MNKIISLHVKSDSSKKLYEVMWDGKNLTCTCKGGLYGPCKHRINLLNGDVSSLVGGQQREYLELMFYIPNSAKEAAYSLKEHEKKRKEAYDQLTQTLKRAA